MRFPLRTTRWVAVSAVAACAIVATIAAAATPAAVDRAAAPAAHKCLTMAGSGDGAFTRNFNPFTGTGLPSGTLVNGAFYEPLLITPVGKTSPQPWLARSYSWTNRNRTLRHRTRVRRKVHRHLRILKISQPIRYPKVHQIQDRRNPQPL